MTALRVRVIVPRRVDCGERDRLWRYCRPHWDDPDWDVVESHHDNGGPFNRAEAINAGAVGGWDVAVIIDSDIVIDDAQIRAAIVDADRTGQLVLPYKARKLVTPDGTRRILAGQHGGPWDTVSRVDSNSAHCSSVTVVPRVLWDRVGGFDERFVGWGGEDDAFHAACLLAGDGVRRLDGWVYHLHHRASPEKDWRAPLYLQCKALSERYVRLAEEGDAAGMNRLLDEKQRAGLLGGDFDIAAVIVTTGERWQLAETIGSFERHVAGDDIARRLMCVDTADPAVVEKLAATWDDWDVVWTGKGNGYAPAMHAAREEALRSGQPWVWWMEDDFRFERPAALAAMQAAMPPRCAQMSLMRQAWYEHEVDAGGVIAANPGAFTDVDDRGRPPHVAHRAYWTQNPHLARRESLTRPWPAGRDSERRFGLELFKADPAAYCGVWGRRDDPPWVTHLGDEQAGHGH